MDYCLSKHINIVLSALSSRLSETIGRICEGSCVEEIRLRTGRSPQIVFANGDAILTEHIFTETDAEELLEKLCRHAVYAHEDEIRNGFITVDGGIRIGVCGRAVSEKDELRRFSRISSFNIRIPREAVGCAEDVLDYLTDHGRPVSALIVAPPCGGKTTLLRDSARCFSNGIRSSAVKVCIADERGELAGCIDGRPSYDIGARTDVLDLAPKASAIRLFVRTMSPDLIITDEIGGADDAGAIAEAARCGVSIIASAHASSAIELKSRESLRTIMNEGVFKRVLLLRRNGSKLHIVPIKL